jgi:hypothetical protein
MTLPSAVVIEGYLDDQGESPFASWFGDLDPRASADVTVAVSRAEAQMQPYATPLCNQAPVAATFHAPEHPSLDLNTAPRGRGNS